MNLEEAVISQRLLLDRLREIRRTLDPETYDYDRSTKKNRRAVEADRLVFEIMADIEAGRLNQR